MPSKASPNEKPRNWPSSLPYLTAPSYSTSLSQAGLSYLRTKPENATDVPSNVPKGPCSLVKITEIKNQSHPANGQAGLFAAKDLKPGSFILEYLGQIHTATDTPSHSSGDSHVNSNYDLSLDRFSSLAIDADRMGNEARFVNDYRGISDRPNAEFKEVWDGRRKERGMAFWVLPVGKSGKGKGIKKGEEILVSYGRGFWDARKDEAEAEAES